MQRRALSVQGIVQGVGFRPFVWQLAQTHQLAGWVQNTHDGVRIEIQGETGAVDDFLDALRLYPPPHARIDSLNVREMSLAGTFQSKHNGFVIRESAKGNAPLSSIASDLATCGECLDEIRSPNARRYRYPFTNCAQCGPRYSLVEKLPYDRLHTAMRTFQMCPDCQTEYNNPQNRRYHAQPIACPACGPHLQILDRRGRVLAQCDEALMLAVDELRRGRIVALKGLGGFQLCVDATNYSAVKTLRERKRRPHKPLAIMCQSAKAAQRFCQTSSSERNLLSGPAAPIVLLKKTSNSKLADAIAPDNPYLGVMLPYTPLHHLLLESIGNPLVCTSGNFAEEPMSIDTDEALRQLGGIADVFLTHNRPIVRAVDDSIARVSHGQAQILRRARGYAAVPIELFLKGPHVIAFGAHLKNTVALTTEKQIMLSQHIGNLTTLQGVNACQRTIGDMLAFYQIQPDVVACDLHPDYASTQLARRFASEHSLPLDPVQHHHAHICACMAEHGLDGPLLGLAWDGTGYGPDGGIWGGEALVCTYKNFTRAAYVRAFPLPGGEQAIREPRRAALGMAYEIYGSGIPPGVRQLFIDNELVNLYVMLDRDLNSPRSTSIGRLFDAVAVLAGIQEKSTFDGHAAMAVEFAAEQGSLVTPSDRYPFPLRNTEPAIADWEPMLRAVIDDREKGTAPEIIAMRFHNSLATLALDIAQHLDLPQVVLSGGCFQNALLTGRIKKALENAGFKVHSHIRVPPNDGGISVGQAMVAAARYNYRTGE